MSRKQRTVLRRIAMSAALLIAAVLLPLPGLWRLAAFLIPYFVIGYDVLLRAGRNILHGQVFDENFLMGLATLGAFGTGDYPEAVAVMLFYQVGELFQSVAVGRSRASIAALMDIRPDHANVERGGVLEKVDPDTVGVDEIIAVKPGEKIPLDGVVISGRASLNTTALTGESLPRDVEEGDAVVSGCVSIDGLIRVRVTHAFGESTVSRILELVEHSSASKARSENFITRFARYYTPAVVLGALCLAILPPLLLGGSWGDWIHRGLVFLVVSCPCALVISVPLSFFGGIGGASRQGILVKGSNYLEALSEAQIVVFDKTGTLTKGTFQVTAIHPEAVSEERLLEYAALAESYSSHPIALSLRSACKAPLNPARVGEVAELSGQGIRAVVDGHTVHAGNGKLMDSIHAAWRDCHRQGTIVHVAVDGDYAGHIVISDEIKADAPETIRLLKGMGVEKTVMLTGDRRAVGEDVARALSMDQAYAELLPGDKVDRVEELLGQRRGKGKLVFVGDGINDAPVLARADIGVAMGAMGSDAAIEAADVVLMDDRLAKLAQAIRISQKTKRIVTQNIVFALGVKAVILALGTLNLAGMWAAVFADVGVSVIAILNAARAMRGNE